jgi:hypothetical protein
LSAAPYDGFRNELSLVQEDTALNSDKPLRSLINATGLVGQAASLVVEKHVS